MKAKFAHNLHKRAHARCEEGTARGFLSPSVKPRTGYLGGTLAKMPSSIKVKFAEFHFHEGGCMRWQQALIALWDVINAEGSLAVTQGIVVAVYGLDLVVTGPAIYVIHTVGVARVDKVVTVAGVHLVVAFAG